MAKLAIDAAGPQLEAQRERIARERLAPQVAAVIDRVVDGLDLDAERRARVPGLLVAAVADLGLTGASGRRALPAGRGSR